MAFDAWSGTEATLTNDDHFTDASSTGRRFRRRDADDIEAINGDTALKDLKIRRRVMGQLTRHRVKI